MWVKLKTGFETGLETCKSKKIIKKKYSLLCITTGIKKLIEKTSSHTRKTSSIDIKNRYKRFRAHVQKMLRDAYSAYVSYMSQCMTKPTMRFVRPAKTQISLRIRAG